MVRRPAVVDFEVVRRELLDCLAEPLLADVHPAEPRRQVAVFPLRASIDDLEADSRPRLQLLLLQEQLLLSLGMLLCTGRMVAFVLSYELNGVNSSLGGFLLVALAGCLFESLLATFDLGAGRMRRVCSFALFLLQ